MQGILTILATATAAKGTKRPTTGGILGPNALFSPVINNEIEVRFQEVPM